MKKQKKIKACLIDIDEYFYRDNEMARPTIERDVKTHKERL